MGEGEAGTRVSMDASRFRSRLCPATSRLITVTKVAAPWAACMGLVAMWLMSVMHRLLSLTGRRHSVPPSSAHRIVQLWMTMCKGTVRLPF